MPTFLTTSLSPMRRSMTPNGQAGTQYPQPLQMSSCTTTVPNSVRNNDPVGQTSRQPACVQCLHTSDSISQRNGDRPSAVVCAPGRVVPGIPRSTEAGSTGAAPGTGEAGP